MDQADCFNLITPYISYAFCARISLSNIGVFGIAAGEAAAFVVTLGVALVFSSMSRPPVLRVSLIKLPGDIKRKLFSNCIIEVRHSTCNTFHNYGTGWKIH